MSRTSSIRIAAAVLAAGGVAASALLTTGGGGGGSRQGVVGPGPLHHPLVYQSAGGNDSTCRRNLRGRPCLTVAKACSLARPNYVIYKIGASPARVAFRPACGGLSGTANLWVNTSAGGSPSRCSPACAYNATHAYGSMQAAQTAASAGDQIVLKCGAYGAQSLTSGAKASVVNYYAETYVQATTAVDVLTATSCVTVDSLAISIDKVHVHGIQATAQGFENSGQTMSQLITLDVSGSNTDVLVDGWRGHAVRQDGQNITFNHMEIGNANYCSPTPEERDTDQMIAAPPDGDQFINSVAHDWFDGSAMPDGACGQGSPGGHDDCIQSNGGNNQNITGDLFYKCGSSSVLQWGEFSGGTMGTITVENDYFGSKPTEFNILSMGQGHCAGLLIRNNVFEDGAFDNDGSCTGASPTQDNNVMLASVGSCSSGSGLGFVGNHNVFVVAGGATCGTNSKRCAPVWSHGNPSGFNYWQPGLDPSDTCAKAYASSDFPTLDFYQATRPSPAAAGMVEGG